MRETRKRAFLIITVFITGASVMVLEIVGAKLIHPFFGVSLYVWASMIAVTLLALSAGYWLGGVWADRFLVHQLLFFLIFIAGIFILMIPIETILIRKFVFRLELRLGVVLASLFLFFLPLFCLGTVMPSVLKLMLTNLEKTGITAGNLYAVSTFGSLTGTIVPAFWLIPFFTLTQLFIFTGVVLLVLAFAGLFIFRIFSKKIWLVMCLLALLSSVFLLMVPKNAESGEFTTLYKSNGFYGQLRVIDFQRVRALLVNGSPQNFVLVDEPKHDPFRMMQYEAFLSGALLYQPSAKTGLMVGLGAGHVERVLSEAGVLMDVIEIDPRMSSVARDFFSFEKESGHIYYGDGRYWINRLAGKKKYDLLIMDAFSAYDLPDHLFTAEFLDEAKKIMEPDGVLGLNTGGILTGPASRVSASIFQTLQDKFKYVEAVHLDAVTQVNNVIFYASDRPLQVSNDPSCRLRCGAAKELELLIEERSANGFMRNGIILSDRYNPLSIWAAPIYRAYRDRVLSFFGENVFSDF